MNDELKNSQNMHHAPEYLSSKSLIERARTRGHKRLRMPSGLEEQFSQHFTTLSRKNFYASFYFVLILLLLLTHLLIFSIEIEDLAQLLQQTFVNSLSVLI
jgi:hypothetical protein